MVARVLLNARIWIFLGCCEVVAEAYHYVEGRRRGSSRRFLAGIRYWHLRFFLGV
jgi:hypothetical protein